jgi:hypothetical protein
VGASKAALPTLGRIAGECMDSSVDFGCMAPTQKTFANIEESYPIWE